MFALRTIGGRRALIALGGPLAAAAPASAGASSQFQRQYAAQTLYARIVGPGENPGPITSVGPGDKLIEYAVLGACQAR